MTWWGWVLIGILLLGAELVAIDAQFYLIFLGVSAIVVGLAGWLGVDMPQWVQWGAFGVLSLIFFFTFRKTLYEKLRSGAEGYPEGLDGDSIKLGEALAAGAEGRTEHRGAKWTVRNIGEVSIEAGGRARVVKADGLTLHVEAE